MVTVLLKPTWVTTMNIGFELVFAFITLLVALYAFRAQRLMKKRELTVFGSGFLLISASYFVLIFNHVTIWYIVSSTPIDVSLLIKSIVLHNLGLHIMLYIGGLATLAYMTCKVACRRLYFLLLVPALLGLGLSSNKLLVFYLLSTFYLMFIVYHAYRYYTQGKIKSPIIVIAFGLLLLARIDFIFSMSNSFLFVVGHAIELVGYSLILYNLIRVLRR